jgi:bacterioferritin-associated ferredoxin
LDRVSTLANTELLVLQRPVVQRVLQRDPQLMIHLLELGSKQAQQFLRQSNHLKELFLDTKTKSPLDAQTMASNTVIFSSGDKADAAYLLLDGQVEIVSPKQEQLYVVQAGECFGEIGVMLDLPRNATARTLSKVSLARLKAEAFNQSISAVDGVKNVLLKLWRGYQFDSDYVKQFGGQLSQSGQRTTLVRLGNKRVAMVVRDPDRPGYKAKIVSSVSSEESSKRITWGGSPQQPWFRLRLVNRDGFDRVQSVVATVDRPETAALYRLLIESTPLTPEMVRSLVATGMACPLRKDAPELVCRCLKVPRQEVEAAIHAGCDSVASVSSRTGCGSVCGACKTEVAGMIVRQIGYPEEAAVSTPVDQRVFSIPLLDGLFMKAGPAMAKIWGFMNIARPGAVSLGAVLLPWLYLLDVPQIGLWILLWALVFLYDTLMAHQQWREVFVDMLQGGIEIQDDEEREEGFTEEGDKGPRNVVMRRLPFWQWMRYKYTLRQDYVLNSSWRWLRHQIRSFCLERGWSVARRWHPKYQEFWGDPARQLAELCLETSLCLGVVTVGDDESGRRVAIFRFVDWLCPAGIEVPGEILPVSMLELQVDLNARRALVCRVNGDSVGVGNDALCFLYLALSGYHHTVLHAYSNWAAMPHHDDPHVRRGAMWTLATNAVALYTGRVCQHDPRSMERVLKYNGRRGMARHGSGKYLQEVSQHSRFANFVLKARRVFIETMVEEGLEIDVEALFLMTVVHSLDHYMAGLCVDPHDLVRSDSDHRAAQVVRLIFSEPLEPVLVNTRLSAVKDGWPKILFTRLAVIDADLASRVDVGIAY